MKKLGLFLLALCLIVSLPGCGKEKKEAKDETKETEKILNCKDESVEGIITTYTLKFDESDTLKDGSSDITMTYPDNITEADITKAIEEMQTAASESGMNLSYKKNDDSITFTLSFTSDKISEFLGTDYEDKTIKYDELKKVFEEKQYTCN